jgi:hypothetical protein
VLSALNSCSSLVNMHSQNPLQFHTHSIHHANANNLNNLNNNNNNCQNNNNINSLANHIVTNPSISNFMPYNPFTSANNLLSNSVQSNGLSSLSCNYSPIVTVSGDHRSSSIAALRLKAREHSVALSGL